MKTHDPELLVPRSIVGNYPNSRCWDAEWNRNFRGDQETPEAIEASFLREGTKAVRDEFQKSAEAD